MSSRSGSSSRFRPSFLQQVPSYFKSLPKPPPNPTAISFTTVGAEYFLPDNIYAGNFWAEYSLSDNIHVGDFGAEYSLYDNIYTGDFGRKIFRPYGNL